LPSAFTFQLSPFSPFVYTFSKFYHRPLSSLTQAERTLIMSTQKSGKVILIGYRATGKSTVGRLLAARLGVDFLDMDKVIVEREGCTIEAMVAAHGWPYFRERERRLLRELVDRGPLVVATGGGAILHQDLWAALMKSGLVVWLAADQCTIRKRLAKDGRNRSQRPGLTKAGTQAEIEAVLAEREPLYAKGCHLTIDTGRQSPAATVAAIIQALGQP